MNMQTHSTNKLLEGWAEVVLNDIAEIIMGQSPPSETYNSEGIGLPFFQGKAEFTDLHPVAEKWCRKPNKIAEAEDILMSVRAPVGTTNIANQTCCIGRGLAAIRYKHNTKFLFYFLRLIERKLDEKGTGTTFKAISGEVLRNIDVPLPPLHEQHAIVSKIEQLFSELDKGIESLKTAQKQIKVYRQSVLKSAFDGKLTEQWRQNKDLPDAQELLEKIQKEREEKAKASGKKLKPVAPLTKETLDALPALPEGWSWVRSGELYGFVTSGSRGWAKYYSEDGAIFLRITNLNFDSLDIDMAPENIQYVKQLQGTEGQRTRVFEGDFLFSITGYLGMFAIAPKLDEAYVNQHIALCRPIDGFDKKYFGYWVIARAGGNYFINQLQKGATKAGLGLDDIQYFPVPLCSFLEQHQIVQEIESRLSECDNMEATITASLQQAEALRQSILKKAFEGKLLNDKELETVRDDPAWEPAEKLLERIKATPLSPPFKQKGG